MTTPRTGYWLARIAIPEIDDPLHEIIYVEAFVGENVYFQECATALELQLVDITGRDLHLTETEGGLSCRPLADVTFVKPLFAISLGAFGRSPTWGDNVYVMRTFDGAVDDEDTLFNDLLRFRTTIQSKMTAHIPTARPRVFTIPFAHESFLHLSQGAHQRKFIKKSFASWVYTPTPTAGPGHDEYSMLMIAMKIPAGDAYYLIRDAKATGTSIVIKNGEVNALKLQRKRLVGRCPEVLKTTVATTARHLQELSQVVLQPQQIEDLEASIGPFRTKTPKNATVPTRFIEDRREGDPAYVRGCTMTLKYIPAKASLQVSFKYIIRNSLGKI